MSARNVCQKCACRIIKQTSKLYSSIFNSNVITNDKSATKWNIANLLMHIKRYFSIYERHSNKTIIIRCILIKILNFFYCKYIHGNPSMITGIQYNTLQTTSNIYLNDLSSEFPKNCITSLIKTTPFSLPSSDCIARV